MSKNKDQRFTDDLLLTLSFIAIIAITPILFWIAFVLLRNLSPEHEGGLAFCCSMGAVVMILGLGAATIVNINRD